MGYDKIPENDGILLDLPFYEGGPIVTRDQGKPHHEDVLPVGTPTYPALASGLKVITLDGATEFLRLADADCADLDFTAGDYSIGMWFTWSNTGIASQILLGRYALDQNGWEIYVTDYGGRYSVTLRHHHTAGSFTRTGCFSYSWPQDVWCFMGISRSGANSYHYRNAIPLVVTGSLEDPESCAEDLRIGVRYTEDTNFLKGSIWRPRIWDRIITAAEWRIMFDKERAWFGV